MKLLRLLALLLLLASTANAQIDLLEYRPKVIEIGYRGFSNYQSSYVNSQGRNVFSSDQLLTVRVGVPLVLKEKTLFGVQLKYLRQTYHTEFIPQNSDDIYRYLNEEKLINSGLNFLYQRNLDEKRKIIVLGATELASDTTSVNRYSARYLISGSYNIRKSERLELGYGMVFNYALGVFNVYPTFTYIRALSSKTMIEATLPSYISLRYHPTDKAFLIFKTQFDNWRYSITDALSQEPAQLTLQRADLFLSLIYEREIYDWLWTNVEASYVNNVVYLVSLPGERWRDPIQEYHLKDAAYLKFSLVIVPPRKLWEKVK